MRIAVSGEGTTPLLLPDSPRAAGWFGPPALSPSGRGARLRRALDSDDGELPPLRMMVVQRDRVAFALDPSTPGWPVVLEQAIADLLASGVVPSDIEVVSLADVANAEAVIPEGVGWSVHDPDSRSDLAYLAATRAGRRVYLNRRLTDADLVVAIGRLERSPLRMFGGPWARETIAGPWNVVYPGMSDAETRQASAALPDERAEGGEPALHAGGFRESREVASLLGSLYEIGIVPGADDGVHDILAGSLHGASAPIEAVRDAWRCAPTATADLAVARIGRVGASARWADLVSGILSAIRLVRAGGRLLVFCPLSDPPGPAVSALAAADEARARVALRGLHEAPDYLLAQALADIPPAWHVAVSSGLDRDTIEGLGFIQLGGVAAAQRLVDAAESCLFIDRPEITGIRVPEGP